MGYLKSLIAEDEADVVHVEVEHENTVMRKIVSYQDYLKMLNDSRDDSKEYCHLGFLPDGYYDAYIDPFDMSNFKVIVIIPNNLRRITYYKDTYNITFPTLAFYFEVHDKKLTDSKVFAVRGTVTDNSMLYRYPFGNVYNDGRICWGANKIPTINQMKEINLLPILFLDSETNDDLYVAVKNIWKDKENDSSTLSQRQLLEQLKERGEQEFPYEILEGFNNTIGDLLSYHER